MLKVSYTIIAGSGGIYGTGCNFEGGGVRVSLEKITKIRAFPHPVPYMPPDPPSLCNCLAAVCNYSLVGVPSFSLLEG